MPSSVSQVSQSAAWILRVRQRDRHALERQRLALGIEAQRHRGAGAERRPAAGRRATARCPGRRPPPARRQAGGACRPAPPAGSGPRAVSVTTTPGAASSISGGCRRGVEIALGPRRQDVRHVDGVAAAAEQVIGVGERDEALGVLGGDEDAARVLDADDLVDAANERSAAPCAVARSARVRRCSAMSSRNSRRMRNGRPAIATSTSPCVRMSSTRSRNRPATCAGSLGRRDRDHRARLRYGAGRRQHGGAAETVADQQRGRAPGRAQVVGRGRRDRRRWTKTWCWRTPPRWRRAR